MTLLRPRTWTLLAALLGGFATSLVTTLAQLHFAYRALGLHVALETAAAFVAFLVAHLVYGRFRQTGRIDDLTLTLGLGVIAFANFFFAAIPAAVSNANTAPFATWASLPGRLSGEALFSFAAFAPRRRLANPPRTARIGMVGCFALLSALAAGMALAADHLPAGLDPTAMPRRTVFLAVGAALATVARWNYLLYPSLYSPWVYTGDAFRLASYVVFWFGAAREIGNYWRSRAEKAVLEERRRLARELHDGVAQELGFIAARYH